MKKYSTSKIFDYISGNELEDIDELENDWEFLYQVIEKTSDKKMYNICDEKIKGNVEFTKLLINKFNKDLDFIYFITNEYAKNAKNDNILDIVEISILINKYAKGKRDLEAIPYMSIAYDFYDNRKEVYERMIDEKNKTYILAHYEFLDRPLIEDFFAEKMIEEIFSNTPDFNLEEYMHNKFIDISKIEKLGINNIIVDYVDKHDIYLSHNVQQKPYLINEVKEKIKHIIQKWDEYVPKKDKIINSMIKDIESFALENDFFAPTLLDCYVGDKLDLLDSFIKVKPSLKDESSIGIYDIDDIVTNNMDEKQFQKLGILIIELEEYAGYIELIDSRNKHITEKKKPNKQKIYEFPTKTSK